MRPVLFAAIRFRDVLLVARRVDLRISGTAKCKMHCVICTTAAKVPASESKPGPTDTLSPPPKTHATATAFAPTHRSLWFDSARTGRPTPKTTSAMFARPRNSQSIQSIDQGTARNPQHLCGARLIARAVLECVKYLSTLVLLRVIEGVLVNQLAHLTLGSGEGSALRRDRR